MNYTENYHLPQWEETDRVMRTDFNQMCADIESGLLGNAQAAEQFRESGEAQDQLLMKRLLRLAYNQYLTLRRGDLVSDHPSMFYQNGIRDLTMEDAGGTWDGARFVSSGTGGLNSVETFLSQYVEIKSNLKLDRQYPAASRPLEVEICMPGTTRLEKIGLGGRFSENTPHTPIPLLLTLTNQDNGEVEQRFPLQLIFGPENGNTSSEVLPIILFFHVGTHYLLKIEPVGDPLCSCDLHLTSNVYTKVQSAGGGLTRFDISNTIHGIEESSLGLFFVQCKGGGPTGKLTIKWDGREITPDYVCPIWNEQGLELRQMLFIRRDTIPKETTFSVKFDCGAQGSIWFQEWGAVLL